MKRKNLEEPVIALVAGMAMSGTTYLARIIATHPEIDCGFECGLLLADSPSEFHRVKPFYDWLSLPVSAGHWGIEDRSKILACKDWMDAYRALKDSSPIGRNCTYILDKTPRYMMKLDEVLQKVPNTHCIVSFKDDLHQFASRKKRGKGLPVFIRRRRAYYGGLTRAVRRFGERILIVSHRQACTEPEKTADLIFEFIGIDNPNRGTSIRHLVDHRTPKYQDSFRFGYEYEKAYEKAVASLTDTEKDVIQKLPVPKWLHDGPFLAQELRQFRRLDRLYRVYSGAREVHRRLHQGIRSVEAVSRKMREIVKRSPAGRTQGGRR